MESTSTSTTPPPVIQITQLVKNYGGEEGVFVHALRGIDLRIFAGEMVAVMGSSGSGKSTLMNILGCLDRPTSGSYLLEGEGVEKFDADRLAEIRNRKIGFVFQNFNLIPRTSAMENVELPLIYAGVPARERQDRARSALKSVGLENREHHYPNQLSGGQQQRVAIARALVSEPLLLLADEPTGNLDSRTSLEIMAILQNLNTFGLTIALVTHESDIAAFCRREVVFRDGTILRDIPIEQKNARALLSLAGGEALIGPTTQH